MAKSVVLCADDYGFNETVSEAICNLIEAGRLSATSVMSSMPSWSDSASLLFSLKSQVNKHYDIGLHLNFTDGVGLTGSFKGGFPSLKNWLVNSHAYTVNVRQLQQEMAAQLDRFCDVAGCLPDFIDGHQHVHQFPVFQRALLEMIRSRNLQQKTWIRTTHPSCVDSSSRFKQRIISITGARKFAKICHQHHLTTNKSFAGITNFKSPYLYRNYMQYWLKNCSDNTLIMCHPGIPGGMPISDNIAQFRKIEYDYLISDDFIEDCATFNVGIKAGSQIFHSQ